MRKEFTVSEFTYNLMEIYVIDEENFNTIRTKIIRELKKNNYWEKGKVILSGKTKTKFFDENILIDIRFKIEDYLLKKGNIDIEKYKIHKNSVDEHLDEILNYEEKENTDYKLSFSMSEKEKIFLMISALYHKFFEPINEKLYEKDQAKLHLTEFQDYYDVEFFKASERAKNPLKSYIKEKKR